MLSNFGGLICENQKMESLPKSTNNRRFRKKKLQRELKLLKREFRFLSKNLKIRNPVVRRERIKRIKKIRQQRLGSFIECFSEKQILCNSNKNTKYGAYKHSRRNLFVDSTDLCDANASIDNSNSSELIFPSCKIMQKNESVIDLSEDKTDQSEVIDLTEAISTPRINCALGAGSSLEPAVIDITEEDFKDQNYEVENDDVLVIGTFNKNSNVQKKSEAPSFISLSNNWNNIESLVSCSQKFRRKFKKRSVLRKIDVSISQFKKNCDDVKESSDKNADIAKVGENVYVNSPVTLPSKGLRPIIIDGSNVAFVHSGCNFSCKRLEICINYFKEKGHKVTAFVPQFRVSSHKSDNPQLLRKLEREGDVVLTPSKKVDGRNIVPYDDRFIVQTAVLKGGIIVSRDNFKDLLIENPDWAETIKYRTLAFIWVDDVLMFPKDPLGEHGPSLEDFLRFK